MTVGGGWSWPRIARRIRVPLGFAFALLYIWFARPAWWSLAAGGAIAIPGLLIRAIASGHVRKNRELTTSGPYRYTRNPLYLGSLIIAAGFALCSRNGWIAAGLALIFLAVYLPVIGAEEQHLRSEFSAFEEYSRSVPRLFPRFSPTPESAASSNSEEARFSRQLYLKHREYNSLLGAAGMLLALAAKIIWFNG